jgi:hypothetical protein
MEHRDLLSKRVAFKTELSCKTEKQIVNCNLAQTAEGVSGMLNLPWRKRVEQRTKLPALNSQ